MKHLNAFFAKKSNNFFSILNNKKLSPSLKKQLEPKFEILKQKMKEESDLQNIYNYFFDHFGENSEFIGNGEPAAKEHVDILIEMLGQTGQKLFQKQDIAMMMLMFIKDIDFPIIHGSCFMEGSMCMIIYLPDEHQGLLGITKGQRLEIVRITGTPIQEGYYYHNPNDGTVH